jgi:protein-disulfide isomerase
MHNKIFDEQNKLGSGTIAFSEDDLKTWASQVSGLDASELASCVSSGKYNDDIQADFQLGVNSGVSGTPTFFIGNEEKDFVQIVGAQPYEVIKQAIDQQLAN